MAKRVAAVLKEVEEKYPTVGTALLPVFFPGSLRAKGDDLAFWREAISAKTAPNKFGSCVDDFLSHSVVHAPTQDVPNDIL